ncbi:DUF6541 family protein [Arthrobacter sp. B0490]|uniref:DUF6541 family protein n=1 Tax=Arthrobacter sp. B0490 TaxID=2058891 RepID=UPI0011B021A7|nr:DUF6541 family protein [Arthrobacter sp. B0490]
MSWWSTAPVLAATIAVMVGPGLVIGLSLGFRRLALLGVAPVFSVGIAGLAAVLGSVAGIPWTSWLLLAVTVLTAAIGLLISRLAARRSAGPVPRRDSWALVAAGVAGAVIGGVLIARSTVRMIGAPEHISQRFDNVFHLNAVRYIFETGDASTLTLGTMTGNSGFAAVYPAAWHSFGALAMQLTGASVPLAVNAVNIVTAAVVWPISALFLARVVVGPRMVGLVTAGVTSAGYMAFPYLLMAWGPLFPYMLSVALLPAALALVVLASRMGASMTEAPARVWIALAAAFASLGFSHMSSVNTLLALGLPVVLWSVSRQVAFLARSGAAPRRYLPWAAGTVVGLAVFVVVWLKLRPVPYDVWGPHQTTSGAVGEVLGNAPMDYRLMAYTVSALALIGLIHAARTRRSAWLILSFVVIGYLYLVDASIERGPWRAVLTGIWYADTNRLAAVLPVVSVVLAALGAVAVVDASSGVVRRLAGRRLEAADLGRRPVLRGAAAGLGLVALAGLLVPATQPGAVSEYVSWAKIHYVPDSPSSILSTDEQALLDRFDGEVPEDAVIAVNPWNGSSLAYAYTGRETLVHHLFETSTPQALVLARSLDDAAQSAEACQAIRDENVSYALDFGTQYLIDGEEARGYPGLADLATSDAVRLVDEQGAARLYEVVVCQ